MGGIQKILAIFGKNQRREHRFRVLPLHRIAFEARIGTELFKIPVANISTQGIGLMWRNRLKNASRFEGKVNVDGRDFVTELEVRHQTESLVGCLFMEPPPRLAQSVRHYLAVEMQAVKLVRVDEKMLKVDSRGDVHWYTDGGKSEIYFVSGQGRVVHFHLSFMGLYLEGGEGKSLRTGHISNADGADRRRYDAANLLDIEREPAAESLALATRLIESAENLPDDQRRGLLAFLQPRP